MPLAPLNRGVFIPSPQRQVARQCMHLVAPLGLDAGVRRTVV
jgi:hypothetical protein